VKSNSNLRLLLGRGVINRSSIMPIVCRLTANKKIASSVQTLSRLFCILALARLRLISTLLSGRSQHRSGSRPQRLHQSPAPDRHFLDTYSGRIKNSVANRWCNRQDSTFPHPLSAIRARPSALFQNDCAKNQWNISERRKTIIDQIRIKKLPIVVVHQVFEKCLADTKNCSPFILPLALKWMKRVCRSVAQLKRE